jgi:hypothetical protein
MPLAGRGTDHPRDPRRGTVVRVRLDRKATSIVLLVVLAVREDGQKVLLAVKNMGGETSEAWRAVLDDLVKRGLCQPDFLIRDAGVETHQADDVGDADMSERFDGAVVKPLGNPARIRKGCRHLVDDLLALVVERRRQPGKDRLDLVGRQPGGLARTLMSVGREDRMPLAVDDDDGVPVQRASAHARVFDHAGTLGARAIAPARVAFRVIKHVGLRIEDFSRLNGWPMPSPVNASPPPSQMSPHDSEASVVRYTFTARDFHSLLFAGFAGALLMSRVHPP